MYLKKLNFFYEYELKKLNLYTEINIFVVII